VHPFFAVKEKLVDVPYIPIYAFLKAFCIFSPERIGRNSLYIKIINCIFSIFFFPLGQNIVDLGVETSIGLVRLPRLRQNLETTKNVTSKLEMSVGPEVNL
jgi:hypothetical protein